MNLVGHPCISFLTLLKKLEDHILLYDGVLEHLRGSFFLDLLRADEKIHKLQRHAEHFDDLFLACEADCGDAGAREFLQREFLLLMISHIKNFLSSFIHQLQGMFFVFPIKSNQCAGYF